jgi:hypothetical protein
MTKVLEKALIEVSQTLPTRIRKLSIGLFAYSVAAILGLHLPIILLPFGCLFIGGLYGWVIGEYLLAPPIVACVRKLGFSNIWVEKTKKAVIYVGAIFFAFGVFASTYLN